ncbi:MAG: ROK family protein [Planctomycetota bacterium]|jgi:glucokinase|nr:ROK family protein [Planctomycetota bacterium]
MAEYYVGVDLGGTNLRAAVVDGAHKALAKYECATRAAEGSGAVIARLEAGISEAVRMAGIVIGEVRAVGMGIPGPLNQKSGIVYSAPNMPGWENVPLAAIVSERLGVKSYLENDANCAGWGEYANGAGKGARHMMLVTLGTGIGGAIIIDGRLHTGRDGSAGELGHVCIVDGGRPCGCGARGCVEAYASAPAVAARFKELLDQGWRSPLAAKRDYLTSEDVFAAAGNGDPVALHIVEETGHYLGVLASDVAELLNPERCVVAGGMIRAGALLFDAIRATCRNRNRHPGRTMEILPAQLGGNAGLVGAADQARIRYEAGE